MKIINVFIVLMLSISCNKKDNGSIEPDTSAAYMKKWQLTGHEVTYSYQGGTFNEYATMATCDKDNYLNFLERTGYTYHSNSNKCSANEPDVLERGSWAVAENDTKLIIQSINSATGTAFTIALVNASTLILKREVTQSFGTIYNTYIYTAIP
jgi:hypothetical protein